MEAGNEAPKPKMCVNWSRLAGGLGLLTIAYPSASADLWNNASYGWQKSAAMAGMFGVAAIALVILPSMAKGGWRDVQIWFLTLIASAATLFAGYQNHMASQRNHDFAMTAITTRYEQSQSAIKRAEGDISSAKAEIGSLSEAMGAAELKAIYDDAKAQRDAETTAARGGTCGKNCRAAEAIMNKTLPRIADAKAKEAAQDRLDEAQARLKDEKAKSPDAPKAVSASETEELATAVILLLLTIGGATLAHRGHEELRGAFTWVEPKKVRAAVKPVDTVAKPTNTAAKGLPGFLALCKHGEPVAQKDVMAAVARWWQATGQRGDVPTARALGFALKQAGFQKSEDRNRRVQYHIMLPEIGLKLVAGLAN